MSILGKPHVCPNCASPQYYKSRRKGLLEHFLHAVFFVTPFRCVVCDKRYFRFRFPTTPNHDKHHAPTA